MNVAATPALSAAEIVFAYHARTKHSLKRYAAGPETLDWDTQPNPFREFAGCARTDLALGAERLTTSFAEACTPASVGPAALTIDSVGALLELSMGLSAWKEYGPDRWALRCNPSSGNLHPTEAYVISRNVPGLVDGLHHYLSRDHVLELRCRSGRRDDAPARLWIGLSSVQWREAWKYGERAFRYCQLDVGHALGAFRYAAGALGWRPTLVEDIGSAELSSLMGLDRTEAFSGAEAEDAELLIAIEAPPSNHAVAEYGASGVRDSSEGDWMGRANLLDPRPLYRWPVIGQVSEATQGRGTGSPSDFPDHPPLYRTSGVRATEIILGRRSAQRFDSKFAMSADVFHRLLDTLLDRPTAPWDVWNFAPRVHPIFFVHRVEGLEPGVYALPRHPAAAHALREQLRRDFEWTTPAGTPAHLPFVRLLRTDCRVVARTMNCHQAIASDSCFALSMLCEFEPVVRASAWRYRQLHWEAGLLGHVLYLEAEAAGLRGTGIGCYFDDALHEILGIAGTQFQALYHFTVGRALTDDRISTLPAYPGRRMEPPRNPTA
ncbi:nitroreductase family protein [Bradyrhizobium roseum]|uniref:nitroreductase n=1 Tax=Bradyrhizobium roseum TaxID=3056648 RepID=UPI0026070E65|nr:nitroreductase [Bradyrhizobium roseus]WKA28541.1 nitroreductase [Bradyrhizobium roseus]